MTLTELLRMVAAEVVLERHCGRRLMIEAEMYDKGHAALQNPYWHTKENAVDVFLGILLAEVNVPEIVEGLLEIVAVWHSNHSAYGYAYDQLQEWEQKRIYDIVPKLTR